MRKLLQIALAGSLWATSAFAADNGLQVTNGSGPTLRSVDVGAGVQAVGHALVDATGGQLGIASSPLYVRAASGFFASGAFASGSLAAGSMVDLLTMRGTVAAGTAASNALLTGCIYNSTPITLTNGQGSAVQCSANGYPTVVVSNTNANGQAAAASSSPVVIAKNSGTGSTVAGAAVGTAGSASAEVVTVQGVASMTPFLSNPGTAANWGIGATAAAVPANAGYFGFNSGGNLTGVSSSAPLPTRAGDGTRQAVLDPCEAATQTYAPISITTATTTRIVAPSASNKTYICSMFLTSAAADNVGIVEGTGGTCGTGTAGVIGGTTAANGPNFAANGGVFLQAGGKTAVAQTAGTNVDLCLITSAATPLAGGIRYVQAP